MSKQKNKSDFKAKSMAEMQERGVLVVEILASAAKMVINIGTKTGDVGKFFFFRWHLAKATTSIQIQPTPKAKLSRDLLRNVFLK